MNKTVKTIAWICLVLGVMGLAVDVAMYVGARTMAARVQEAIEAGEFPVYQGRLGDRDIDDDGDVDKDDMDAWRSDSDGWFPFDEMMGGARGAFGAFDSHGGFPGMMDGVYSGRSSFRRIGFGLPLFLLASGPVLTTVGAVMLIVNREPKKKIAPGKKAKSKKA